MGAAGGVGGRTPRRRVRGVHRATLERHGGRLLVARSSSQPNHVPSLGLVGNGLSAWHQKPDEAVAVLRAGQGEVDPLASFPYMLTARDCCTVRRHQDAYRYARAGAHLREGRRVGAVLLKPGRTWPWVSSSRASRPPRARRRRRAPGRRLPRSPGLGTRDRRTERRSPDVPRGATHAAGGRPQVVSEGWLLGALGEIDAAFDVLARAEDQNQALALLLRDARLRSAAGRPAVGGAPAAAGADRLITRRAATPRDGRARRGAPGPSSPGGRSPA